MTPSLPHTSGRNAATRLNSVWTTEFRGDVAGSRLVAVPGVSLASGGVHRNRVRLFVRGVNNSLGFLLFYWGGETPRIRRQFKQVYL